ncbi:hypothetical protein [Pseudonocardia sp. GCM10023141]|uniref:hypothetical protein n=1 Tax=Pseudonocardia sp. GCM10023141 TaxID=3252653 RepID=UPI00360CDA79
MTTAVEAPPTPVVDRFRATAGDVDRGHADLRDGLRFLGAAGLLDTGLDAGVALVEAIAGECMSSAFSLWAQRMVLAFLPPEAAPRPGLADGTVVGSTAMAPALRDVAGIEPVPVLATPAGTGLRLDGPIRWASNLFPDAVVVLPARLPDGGRAVVRIGLGDPGVQVKPAPELLALSATASSSVRLDGVEVGPDAILSTDLPGFVRVIRPAFLLSQTAFCAGLAARAVEGAAEHAVGINADLAGDVAFVAARVRSVRERLHAWAADPAEPGRAELLQLRLDAAGAAGEATRLESTTSGGAGFMATSDVSRRLREAAFLPVQSPTEGQLRWELSRCA